MKSPYIDVHCHLDACKDIPAVVARAQTAGIGIICTQGTEQESNAHSLALSTAHIEVKACLGLYPISALEMTDGHIDTLLGNIRKNANSIVALGEVGIDFKEDSEQHERQKQIFTKIIQLALELDKPVIVHSRKAEQACIELLEQRGAKKVIMHCFCGKWKLVERIIANGWYITVPTSVTRSEQFQRYAKELPLSQLFCETDAPYLHPDKNVRELSNEPAHVLVSYQAIADAKGISLSAVRDALYENYQRLCSRST